MNLPRIEDVFKSGMWFRRRGGGVSVKIIYILDIINVNLFICKTTSTTETWSMDNFLEEALNSPRSLLGCLKARIYEIKLDLHLQKATVAY